MTVCGTPLWTAPEILKGQLYNEAADVYSFSLCLWEVWSMTVPFHELGLGPMEVLLQVVNDDRRPTMPDDIPPLFAELVAKCWATDARERPNFPTVVSELQTFAEMSGIGAVLPPKSFDNMPMLIQDDDDNKLPTLDPAVVEFDVNRAAVTSIGSAGSAVSVASTGVSGATVVSSVFSLEPAGLSPAQVGAVTAL
jgi:serine/threonine protein kinase